MTGSAGGVGGGVGATGSARGSEGMLIAVSGGVFDETSMFCLPGAARPGSF